MAVIAVDGPAASGKGTLARRLAERLGYRHLDTGLLYRAVGARVDAETGGRFDDEGVAIAAARAFDAGWLDQPGLRGEEAGAMASRVSAIPEVRAALLAFQRAFAATPPGAVLDGRDIGTVICPDAAVKLYVTASAEVRAERRLKELHGAGTPSIYAAILKDLTDRDLRDSQRAIAPMKAAPDAFVMDTSGLDADAVFAMALAHVASRLD